MKRSGFAVMARLVGLVRPLAGYMALAVTMGLAGHLCATFLTVFGGVGILQVLGFAGPLPLAGLFGAAALMAVLRAVLRYGEQACNHFIAFKLLALLRDRVFRALRRLAPAKLEGRDKGDLITVITSDIELLEVFYAHTISPALIALLFSGIMVLFIGGYHPLLGLLALAAYGGWASWCRWSLPGQRGRMVCGSARIRGRWQPLCWTVCAACRKHSSTAPGRPVCGKCRNAPTNFRRKKPGSNATRGATPPPPS